MVETRFLQINRGGASSLRCQVRFGIHGTNRRVPRVDVSSIATMIQLRRSFFKISKRSRKYHDGKHQFKSKLECPRKGNRDWLVASTWIRRRRCCCRWPNSEDCPFEYLQDEMPIVAVYVHFEPEHISSSHKFCPFFSPLLIYLDALAGLVIRLCKRALEVEP